MAALLARMAGHAGRNIQTAAAQPLPKAGYYWPGGSARSLPARGKERPALIPLLFYRSMLLAADTAPIDRLCAALSERDVKLLFVNAHTVKGAARSLQFKALAHVLHEAEEVAPAGQGSAARRGEQAHGLPEHRGARVLERAHQAVFFSRASKAR